MNLFAYTPAASFYPPYLSVNRKDGWIEVTVRGPRKQDGSVGDTGTILLSRTEFAEFVLAGIKHLLHP